MRKLLFLAAVLTVYSHPVEEWSSKMVINWVKQQPWSDKKIVESFQSAAITGGLLVHLDDELIAEMFSGASIAKVSAMKTAIDQLVIESESNPSLFDEPNQDEHALPSIWSPARVQRWANQALRGKDVPKNLFLKNEIDGKLMQDLDEKVLLSLGVQKRQVRQAVLDAVQALFRPKDFWSLRDGHRYTFFKCFHLLIVAPRLSFLWTKVVSSWWSVLETHLEQGSSSATGSRTTTSQNSAIKDALYLCVMPAGFWYNYLQPLFSQVWWMDMFLSVAVWFQCVPFFSAIRSKGVLVAAAEQIWQELLAFCVCWVAHLCLFWLTPWWINDALFYVFIAVIPLNGLRYLIWGAPVDEPEDSQDGGDHSNDSGTSGTWSWSWGNVPSEVSGNPPGDESSPGNQAGQASQTETSSRSGQSGPKKRKKAQKSAASAQSSNTNPRAASSGSRNTQDVDDID